ncbi:putative bacterial Ig-like domain 12 [Helianthus anomalus]
MLSPPPLTLQIISYLISLQPCICVFHDLTSHHSLMATLLKFTKYYSLLICIFIVGLLLCVEVKSEFSVNLIKKPEPISNLHSPTFSFQVKNANFSCTNCTSSCKLDDLVPSNCSSGEISYTELRDGNHTFEVCSNGSHLTRCATYDWTIDTVPPTAYVTASTSFTNASIVSAFIIFSESCSGSGGFGCSSANDCSLLVYGQGQVIPNTLKTIKPNLEYSISVNLSTNVDYGRVVLVTDRYLCRDAAGNQFTRTTGSSFLVHFDRRPVYVDLRTHIPEQLLQLDNNVRSVQVTNKHKNLKLYLYFSEPIVNTSTEVFNSLKVSQGSLVPATRNNESLGNRRYGFEFVDIHDIAIVTTTLDSGSLISREGTPVSPVAPVTFLFDSQRPYVRLSTTTHMRTQEELIPVMIKFMKPVFEFNSSQLSVSGGHMQGFHEISKSVYKVDIKPTEEWVIVQVPENVTTDVAGNKNLASNILRFFHYSVPAASLALSTSATAAFVLTAVVATLLTVSTASLQNHGAFATPSPLLTTSPARILFRIVCHIQIFALSGWLAVPLPVEYSEFVKGLRWSIPYFKLPWECGYVKPVWPMNPHSYGPRIGEFTLNKAKNIDKVDSVFGLPLTAMEYKSFFESQNVLPEAEYIGDLNDSHGWTDFKRSMFWLAVMSGSLIILHILFLLILKLRKKKEKENTYVSVIFPRFEIFLVILAVPCVSAASASLLKGGSALAITVGALILGTVIFLILALFMFLSVGISLGKLLQYKEVHHEDQKMHWYQALVKVTLGPGKRGQWTWIDTSNSKWLTILGPLFEDLRGPPKYMLSQISGALDFNTTRSSIIASDDENEDAEAPFVQKVFGILRIYYIFLESIKRVILGILVGIYARNGYSETPTKTLLCVTSFQLFFMVLKKPFIKKKVQLVEIISVSSQVAIFIICLVLLRKNLSTHDQTNIGITMLCLFLLAFVAQILNEWNSLICQIKQLDPDNKSLCTGLKIASWGILLLFVPMKSIEGKFPLKGQRCDGAPAAEAVLARRFTGLGTPERPWMKQLRDLAKGSFSRDGTTDPSSSQTKWSGFWSGKRSGSSSQASGTSIDMKAKPKAMYKDFEAIFGLNK